MVPEQLYEKSFTPIKILYETNFWEEWITVQIQLDLPNYLLLVVLRSLSVFFLVSWSISSLMANVSFPLFNSYTVVGTVQEPNFIEQLLQPWKIIPFLPTRKLRLLRLHISFHNLALKWKPSLWQKNKKAKTGWAVDRTSVVNRKILVKDWFSTTFHWVQEPLRFLFSMKHRIILILIPLRPFLWLIKPLY